jgi:RNA polymerase subunit RPABC4/transcription elongation factor Spt4
MHAFSLPVTPRRAERWAIRGARQSAGGDSAHNLGAGGRVFYTGFMERICSHCHAVLAPDTKADWCPACGGAIVERAKISEDLAPVIGPDAVVDHRGIVLPRRHAVGGVITPQ